MQNLFQSFQGLKQPGLQNAGTVNFQNRFATYATLADANQKQFKYVIVGGGTAGVGLASQLTRENKQAGLGEITAKNTAVIEPADVHYYQPGWSLVGAGQMKKEDTARKMEDVLPNNVGWIKNKVSGFTPDKNSVQVGDKDIEYEYLIIASGYKLYWDAIKGLPETMSKNGVCSIYSYDTVDQVWDTLRSFKGGTALFTQPSTPVKCGGAPQKIMWLAEDYWIKNNLRDKADISFITGTPSMFHAPKYAKLLDERREEHNIGRLLKHDLVEVKGPEKLAYFKNLDNQEIIEKKFDLLHVTPFQGPPEVIKTSPLSNQAGMIDIGQYSMQHKQFKNVFSLGDSSSAPTSKTAAAVMSQLPVLVTNLIKQQKGEQVIDSYDGYTSCPLVLGENNLMLAEFDYTLQPRETFAPYLGDQGKPNAFFYFIKKHVFPFVYWNLHTRGQWFGKNTIIKPEIKPVQT